MSLSNTALIVTLILTVGSNLVWLLNYYGNSEKKRYAAEREFQHLKKNQEQLMLNLDNIFQDVESQYKFIARDLLVIKTKLGIE
ncbi:hypothetical protein H6G54_00810 [Anabaena cylindrica FACHB-243]|uniref:Uncharacterized protein n=1 Tax=Anabaena cylindrica (strain ATCC 27899 / PCC 7122) TaxID=272123 RepID=K9ZKT3_ANACC|nr:MULTISPECIES: hypothetical protein [Anabaena]AFZ59379.1 hypothetical protein Anacy_4009 [Anabaena cylindrica PCC 7122]MBD2416277.1 hypothetical protein [Anabaena cylindrica FACHB-243]MBY5280239.1 hypothetical protein [Anabaena sp. CCAP 1446/1C]MBY5308511.1 hypothetical protein [Anabaena sp. CCAP 1446/1C]MCM2405297.1 hypothetical protein [Anabaena sp. CCAP 1446/1C]